jgi:signal transduction histidine kinase
VVFAVVLLSMTALSLVSAYALRHQSDQRAATADAAIQEYASLGARLFGDRAFGLFEGTRLRILGAIYSARLRPGEALPSFTRYVDDATREMNLIGFAVGDSNRGFFVLDERTGYMEVAGGAARPGMDRRIQAMLRQSPRPRDRRMEPMVWLLSDLPDRQSVGFAALRDQDGSTHAHYGFTYSRAAGWKAIGDAVVSGLPLLPGGFIDAAFRYGLDSSRTDTLIAIRVLGGDGELLYQSRAAFPGSPKGEFTFNTGTSPLRVEATQLRSTLRATRLRVELLAGSWRIPLALDVLLPLFSLAFALLAGVGLWRERQLTGARRDFVASVSHELRTPLAQIRMFTETLLLRRERDEEERSHWLNIISREARRLGDLVENILLFSRIEAERARVEMERTDLGELVEEIVEGYVPVAAQHGMRIVADAPSRISSMVDPRAMRQVVVNLLDNALKYGRTGQLVKIELERAGNLAHLSVSDEGPGIAPTDRRRIFEPFVRLGDRNRKDGSGIGLAVVRDLVTLQGGTVEVRDAAGGGARFTVQLPISESAEGLPWRATGEFRAREAAALRTAQARGDAVRDADQASPRA